MKIKPCPFCGGKATLEQSEPSTARHNEGAVHFAVTCTTQFCLCNVAKFWDIEPSQAKEKWNRRAKQD